MTSPDRAIDLETWQLRGLLALAALAGGAAFLVVWSLVAWEMDLRERETMARIGEKYCLSHRIDGGYISPDAWLVDSRRTDPLWLALDASLVDACGFPSRRDPLGEPYVTADGRPWAPGMKPTP